MNEHEPTPEQIEAIDSLAEGAVNEYRFGQTESLREYASRHGIDLGDSDLKEAEWCQRLVDELIVILSDTEA